MKSIFIVFLISIITFNLQAQENSDAAVISCEAAAIKAFNTDETVQGYLAKLLKDSPYPAYASLAGEPQAVSTSGRAGDSENWYGEVLVVQSYDDGDPTLGTQASVYVQFSTEKFYQKDCKVVGEAQFMKLSPMDIKDLF